LPVVTRLDHQYLVSGLGPPLIAAGGIEGDPAPLSPQIDGGRVAPQGHDPLVGGALLGAPLPFSIGCPHIRHLTTPCPGAPAPKRSTPPARPGPPEPGPPGTARCAPSPAGPAGPDLRA